MRHLNKNLKGLQFNDDSRHCDVCGNGWGYGTQQYDPKTKKFICKYCLELKDENNAYDHCEGCGNHHYIFELFNHKKQLLCRYCIQGWATVAI